MDKKALRWLGAGMLFGMGIMLVIQQIPFLGGYAVASTVVAGLVMLIMSFVK
jgi:MFS superfamily sulfate permease-like transporter